MNTMLLQHPRVLQLKGRGKPKLAFLGGAPSPKRSGDPDLTVECRKKIKASLWERQCDSQREEGSVPSDETSAEISPSHEGSESSTDDNSSVFQEAFLDALVEDRASLINENNLLKKRITELTAQVLALQLYMQTK
jgi:hypothetical protein